MDGTSQTTVPPVVTDTKVIASLVQREYGLTVEALKPLNGYDDLNFHAKVAAEYSNSFIKQLCPYGYLVKITNENDSKSETFNMCQKYVMDHLSLHGIKCQEQVKTVTGEFLSSITLPVWSMDNMMKVKSAVHAVTDTARRQVVDQVLAAFQTKVLPRREEFRKGQVHGDINEQNILAEETNTGVYEVSGILDFQDSAYSCMLYDVALAIAYMMMHPKLEIPAVDVGGHILAGFESVLPLNTAERESLRTLVASRMVMSLVYGAFHFMLDPTNEYLLATSKVGWDNLILFWQSSEETVDQRWNEIIHSYK